ncbi:TPA: formate/nitrite transporter family protein [Candidatus Spyradomonas excrementavium]|nr:formate/nitrite transporter family protein [Candidatus Spyradomonas excrementavium]
MADQTIEAKDCMTPNSVAHELADNVMPAKANFRKSKTFVLAIAAGALIAFGAQVSLTVMTGTAENLSWGIAKLVGAMTFATGLMMVVLTGAELFTGNVMMTFSVIEKKTSLAKLLRNWSIVYFGNFVGSILIALLIYYSGCSHNSHEALGVLSLTTAYQKVNLTFVEAFTRGILCNWLVCLAIWMASSSKFVIGKIFAIFFPIMTFVASGYEHSIANMFFLTNGIFAKHTAAIVAASGLSADQLATLNMKTIFTANLIPVTLGNMVGAIVFVVLLFWTAYLRDDHKAKSSEPEMEENN